MLTAVVPGVQSKAQNAKSRLDRIVRGTSRMLTAVVPGVKSKAQKSLTDCTKQVQDSADIAGSPGSEI